MTGSGMRCFLKRGGTSHRSPETTNAQRRFDAWVSLAPRSGKDSLGYTPYPRWHLGSAGLLVLYKFHCREVGNQAKKYSTSPGSQYPESTDVPPSPQAQTSPVPRSDSRTHLLVGLLPHVLFRLPLLLQGLLSTTVSTAWLPGFAQPRGSSDHFFLKLFLPLALHLSAAWPASSPCCHRRRSLADDYISSPPTPSPPPARFLRYKQEVLRQISYKFSLCAHAGLTF